MQNASSCVFKSDDSTRLFGNFNKNKQTIKHGVSANNRILTDETNKTIDLEDNFPTWRSMMVDSTSCGNQPAHSLCNLRQII